MDRVTKRTWVVVRAAGLWERPRRPLSCLDDAPVWGGGQAESAGGASTGPAKIALKAGAPLLPVFAVRTAAGEFEVDIGRPFDVEEQPDGKSPHVAALQQYAETLEAYVLRFPHLWPNWGYLEEDSGDQRS